MSLPPDWRRAPASTYRIQLRAAFGFEDAAGLAGYFTRLGIAACYSSPLLMARPGSPHGYDIVDHHRINPELGGEEGFERFASTLRQHGLGLILDVVPNHMAADAKANPWWRDVLENGTCSRHAGVFDIDWSPLKTALRHKLLVPLLGAQYGEVLEQGDLSVSYDDGAFNINYYEHELPVNPGPSTLILRVHIDDLRQEMGDDDVNLRELLSIVTGLEHLPPVTSTGEELIEERDREKEILKHRLSLLVEASAPVRAHIERALGVVNGTPGDPGSFDLLHELLDAQPYRLAYWRVAGHEINYRRFFDINDLAAIRMERPDVFEAAHELIGQLLERGIVQGLRIDHPDGLFDPEAYFERLSRLSSRAVPYIVAEKILSANERLIADWAIDGTTGYDFLNDVGGVFVDTNAARRMRRIHGRVSGHVDRLTDVVYRSKLDIMNTSLSSELNVLADALDRLSEADRHSRDYTLNSLRELLAEIVAVFPIYRTYITDRGASEADRQAIDRALDEAQQRNPTMDPSSFGFLRDVLLPAERQDRDSLELTMRLQQFTAPVQAKGMEDTAFYRHNVLISLNEVGGDPARFGRTVAEFHSGNAVRASQWPLGMLATSTHDTKLGEDARMRVHSLAELVDEWSDLVSRWQRLTASSRRRLGTGWAPDGNDIYRFYQTLIACWPADADDPRQAAAALVPRLQQYMVKATREAKWHTSWVHENRAYESATEHFVERVLSGPSAEKFLRAFEPFARRVAALGAVYSLGQVVLKIASPGVPDFYQGSELWTLSLVDPDSRAPVDFARRVHALESLEPLLADIGTATTRPDVARQAADLVRSWPDARVKLYVTAAGLRLRRAHPDVFLAGRYVPLDSDAPPPSGVVAFARTLDERVAIAVAPRLVAAHGIPPDGTLPTPAWGDSRLHLPDDVAADHFVDVFTGRRHKPDRDADGQLGLSLGRLLDRFPVALLWGRRAGRGD